MSNKNIFSDLDSIGRGRLPWMIKPAAIIVITDGGKLTSSNQLKPELIIPGSTLPGSNLDCQKTPLKNSLLESTVRIEPPLDIEHSMFNTL